MQEWCPFPLNLHLDTKIVIAGQSWGRNRADWEAAAQTRLSRTFP